MIKITADWQTWATKIEKLEKIVIGNSLGVINPDLKILVALDENNNFLGYLNYNLWLDEAEIISVATSLDHLKQGVATALIKSLLMQVSACFLDVKESNFKAYNLYLKLGFKKYGKREAYYHDGSTAILMKWSR